MVPEASDQKTKDGRVLVSEIGFQRLDQLGHSKMGELDWYILGSAPTQ